MVGLLSGVASREQPRVTGWVQQKLHDQEEAILEYERTAWLVPIYRNGVLSRSLTWRGNIFEWPFSSQTRAKNTR